MSSDEYTGYVQYIVDVVIPPDIVEFIDKYPERKLSFIPDDDDCRKFTFCYMEPRRQTITESVTCTFDTNRRAERCIDSMFFMSIDCRFRKSSQELLRKHQRRLFDLTKM